MVYENKKNVYILSYDGVVTGSNQLRSYNEHVVSKTYGNNPTGLIDYYNKYDNVCGKKKEPFFDGFLAHMAFLNVNDDEVTTYYNLSKINYYNIEYADTDKANTGELSQLRTTNTKDAVKDFRKEKKYDDGEHIFLLCPTSVEVHDKIFEILKKYESESKSNTNSNSNNLFIHIQGEAIKNDDGDPRNEENKRCKDTGMTPKEKGGLFGEAFNLFSGGIQIQNLRKEFSKSDNIEIYSVKPDCKDKKKEIEKIKEIEYPPEYYVKANEDILEFSKRKSCDESPQELHSNFIKLNVTVVAQDILDKDNLASLAIIGSLKKHTKTELLIVGFRIYNSSTIPDYKTMDRSSFRNNNNNKEETFYWLNFRNKNGEVEKPNDNRNTKTNEHGNIEFLIDDTHKFHMISSIGFMNVLNQTIWDKFVMEYGGIVDGTDVQSESLRAPFNMSAFTFCKGTYMDVGVGENNGAKIKGQDVPEQQEGQDVPEQQEGQDVPEQQKGQDVPEQQKGQDVPEQQKGQDALNAYKGGQHEITPHVNPSNTLNMWKKTKKKTNQNKSKKNKSKKKTNQNKSKKNKSKKKFI